MISVIGFLIILAPLVIVHELGHFLFAKLFNVKAEAFSVGFGPVLWAKKWGETDFRLSAIPLGGYVKLLGEDPEAPLSEADRKRSLHAQEPWKRFFIFFGGPFFNFIWAALVFMVILAIGEPQIASVVARVTPGSEAALRGFHSGDVIQSVNDKPVTKFSEVMTEVMEFPNKEMKFVIERAERVGAAAETLTFNVTPSVEPGFSMYGEEKDVGKIDGMYPFARANKVGVSNPQSIAAKAGFATGDLIESFNGQKTEAWEEIEALYRKSEKAELVIKTAKNESKTITLNRGLKGVDMGSDWGLYSSELFVERAIEDSPAAKAGIQTGDRIVKVDDEVLTSFYGLRDAIQRSAKSDGKVHLTWERNGTLMTVELEPKAAQERDPVLRKITSYTIGVVPMLSLSTPVTVVERVLNPFVLAYKGTERMIDFSYRNAVAIWKMITGKVSVSTLGGPILIGKIAGDSIERGLIAFLTTMAMLSIGLGILNIMPIPVLDGGHLLLLSIEAVRGKPLSIRQTQIVQQVGLSLILLLMIVVIRNDLARVLPIFN